MKIYDRQCVHTLLMFTLMLVFKEYENFFFIINFQKEKANTLTLLIIPIVKILQIELRSTNLLL